MGNYNPRAPYILGEEWVPIQNEDLAFSPAVNSLEVGTGFTLTTARQVRDGRFYARQLPVFTGQAFGVEIYPAGQEDQTGPISSVIIPCNAGSTTGTGIDFTGSASVADAVAFAPDGKGLGFSSLVTGRCSFFFATNQYAQLLSNKRILAVNILYVANGSINSGPSDTFVGVLASLANDASSSSSSQESPTFFEGVVGTGVPQVPGVDPSGFIGTLKRLHLGELSYFWGTNTPTNTTERSFWTYSILQQLEASAANRFFFALDMVINTAVTVTPTLSYLALEVIYCEEKRAAYGARQYGASTIPLSQPYIEQVNIVPLRTPGTLTADPIVAAGNYTAVLLSPNLGDAVLTNLLPAKIATSDYPVANALRELYQIPPHPGVQVNIPTPLEDHLGETFTTQVTHVLPQISLHASGGTLTEPHVYGRQAAAQIYGSNTATQDIYDDISGVDAVYPQVRFYARRFGDTTIPLTLTGVGGLSGSTVSIAVADFDQLVEIIDGWREITLRFSSPPTMGTVAGNPAWTWSAAGETAGNRWEILSACAPAISGIGGQLFNLVPAPNQLGTATYQPPSGDTVELTWMPQGVGSPYVSGATIDATTDAVLIFSQDPPLVTGFTLIAQTQTVTGIGLDCGSLPCCIPSGIAYQRLTWSATSLPSTGFGAYEIQRFDTTPGATFQTIMLATNPAVTGFNDFEARVGITSVYRIRALNVLNFAGSWSTQVSGAPPAPGVTGGCSDQTGALIFTSNAGQSGAYNAAYVAQWEQSVTETFVMPEADMVEYQPMYNRDGSIAFHGTERGLETFTRDVLLQAGAISPIRLADTRTLRDLAWANLPYVCVRDDIGDRWYASVRVPNVSARLNRQRYMARIEIVETTLTPYPVNP